MKYAYAYGYALVIFLIMDALWLGLIARSFYVERMGDLMVDQPRWGAAAIFYLLFVAGVVYFAVAPGLVAGQWTVSAVNGALFGFFAYLTYNFTSLSVIRGFDPTMAIVDTLWGAALGAGVAAVAAAITLTFHGGNG